MALGTVTTIEQGVLGDLKYVILEVQPSSGANYTADGEVMSLANHFGFSSDVYYVNVKPKNEASATSIAFFERSTMKLLVMNNGIAGGTEFAGNTDLSAQRFELFALGR